METWTGDPAHRQPGYRIRFDWGLRGAEGIALDADIAVVIDVLSFTTTLSVALDAGMTVFPYNGPYEAATAYADSHDAVLAVKRLDRSAGEISLSPGSVREASGVSRLVLPSPNGSTVSFELQHRVPTVLAASLRNAAAVTDWIRREHDSPSTVIAVIAAGERWADGSLRPAIEDLWGAGAVIAPLRAAGWDDCSPEAHVAADAFEQVAAILPERLVACASGRELIDRGFGEDVTIAAEIGQSVAVPRLAKAAFTDAGSSSPPETG
jgi:2-phosphosulfolactate phosphatase